MGLSIKEIRENCVRARSLMNRSRSQGFAVGAFNIDNQETLIAICRAAQAKNSPVMVEVSNTEVTMLGHENVREMVDNYKEEYGIEIYVNLDHAPTVEAAKAGVDAGYEFIHIDISHGDHDATDEAIIAGTKEVVEYAKFTGAVVESEPHYFAGGSNKHDEDIDYEAIKDTFTKPDYADDFVRETGIDTFAASVGNLHGSYNVPKQLDIDLLKEVRKSLGGHTNISLHGGSGTPGNYFVDAINVGVSKVNVNSDLRIAFRENLVRVLQDNPHQYAVIKLMEEVIEAVQKVVESKIDMFGSSDRAVV